jgi:hypothetical protein
MRRIQHLTMRLSDAGLRRRETKAVYPDHPFPPWLNEDTAPRSLEPIVRRPHTLTFLRAMILAQLPTYTAHRPLGNLRFEQPDLSNYGLSGGAIAVTPTLKSTPRRTPEGHWRCAFNHRCPLRWGRDFPTFKVAVQRSVRSTSIDTNAPRPTKRCPKFPRTRRRVDRIPATSMRRPLMLKASNDEVERRGVAPAQNEDA